jgi:hypothetical protein
VPTLADRGCRVVSATNSDGRSFRFSRPEPLLSFHIAPRLSSQGWVDPVPNPPLLRKSGSAGNRTQDIWICSQELRPLDHRGGHKYKIIIKQAGVFFITDISLKVCTNAYCILCNHSSLESLAIHLTAARHTLVCRGSQVENHYSRCFCQTRLIQGMCPDIVTASRLRIQPC